MFKLRYRSDDIFGNLPRVLYAFRIGAVLDRLDSRRISASYVFEIISGIRRHAVNYGAKRATVTSRRRMAV